MTDDESARRPPDPDADDPVLAGLAEQVTRRLQSGERVNANDPFDQDPARAGSIRGLLPVLHDLAALGRSIARRRTSRSEGEARGRP